MSSNRYEFERCATYTKDALIGGMKATSSSSFRCSGGRLCRTDCVKWYSTVFAYLAVDVNFPVKLRQDRDGVHKPLRVVQLGL